MREMSISRTIVGVAAFAACLLSAGSVLAVEAVAKSAVNVRTGPGTSFGIVDQLTAGEVVNVTECAPSNFCFVEHNGPDGWVSANYLTAIEEEVDEEEMEAGGGDNPDCSFGFVVGPGGPSLSINCGDAPMPPAPPSPPAAAEACLYTGNNFNGDDLCVGVGIRNALNGTFNNKISSIELNGGAKAMLCDGQNLTGVCKNITTDTAPLQPSINNKTSSFSIYVGAPIILLWGVKRGDRGRHHCGEQEPQSSRRGRRRRNRRPRRGRPRCRLSCPAGLPLRPSS